jgi:uncharacterized repeat protein (TIGR01451 family)
MELNRLSFQRILISAFILSTLAAFAQLDPRERYGSFLGGGTAACYDPSLDGACPTFNPYSYFPAHTSVTAVVVDSLGNTFVAGITDAIDFPTTTGAYRRKVTYVGAPGHGNATLSDDSFLAKFDKSGHLIWSTYLGISTFGYPMAAIRLDANGNIIVAGTIDLDTFYGVFSPIVLKVNSAGSGLLYSKQVFSINNQGGTGTCPDATFNSTGASAAYISASGQVYFVGIDDGGCIPATSGANPSGNGFLVKVNPALSGQGIVYSARTGDQPRAVVADSSGNAYVTGGTDLPIGGNGIVKFDPIGGFQSQFGFTSGAVGAALKLTGSGDVIYTGICDYGSCSATKNFGPATTGRSLFVARFHSDGSTVFSSLIHDPNMNPEALALNSASEAFVTGSQTGTAFRVNPYSNAPLFGAFLLRLNQTGTVLLLDSAFGGDAGHAIAVDSAWNAYVGGSSLKGETFPLTSNGYQSSFKSAASQGFLAKLIIEGDVKMIQSASPSPVTHGSNLTYTLSVFNNGPDVSDGDTITDVLPSGTTFVGFSTTNGTCTHPAVGSGGTFKCTRSTALNKGSYWGPVKLTVHVNAAAGSTLKNTASVAAKTQDVFSSNNTATVYVKVQ